MIIKQSMASTTKAESRLLNSEIVLTEGSVKSVKVLTSDRIFIANISGSKAEN